MSSEYVQLNEAEKKFLLGIARKSIQRFLYGKKVEPEKELYNIPKGARKQVLKSERRVFVSLHTKTGELRGCMGFLQPAPLVVAVVNASIAAAFSDPRFLPLSKEELSSTVIEISVLTAPEEIKCGSADSTEKFQALQEKIKIGKHGIIVEKGRFSALLLPQVAVEHGWNLHQFLQHCCLKAGLPMDAWKYQDCKIYRFSAQIFSEK